MPNAQQKAENLETFADLVRHFQTFGNRQALVDVATGEIVSYAELSHRIERAMGALPDAPPGSRVILYDIPPLEWVPLFFAITLRGMIAVPLDARAAPEFLSDAVAATSPSLIVTGHGRYTGSTMKTITGAELLAAREGSSAHGLLDPDPDSPTEILFTSGTWAQPKGVVLSQRNILSNAQQILHAYDHDSEDISLSILPLSHAYQQTAGLILPLICGSPIVYLTTLTSRSLTKALNTYRIRTMLVVPRVLSLIEGGILRRLPSHRFRRMAAMLIRACRFLPRGVRRVLFFRIHQSVGQGLTTLVVGGAPLPSELDHFFRGLGYRVVVGYGASECSPVLTISDDKTRNAGEVGTPLLGVEISFSEADEIVARGPNIFLGYWPHVTRPGYFNTGDIAKANRHGTLTIMGRTKNLVIYPNGDKIFCEDIEHVARSVPGVKEACAVGLPGPSQQPILRCVVHGDESLKELSASVCEQINARLPFNIRIDRVVVVSQEDFPYTHTLKPDRKRIRDMCLTNA